jgi:PD-(D/E)XK nuclease superfamily
VVDKLEDTKWHDGYRRQMEIYQWLLQQQDGLKVSNTGYFVYVNGQKDRAAFDGKLEFDVKLIEYTGKQDWIPGVLDDIKKLLDQDAIPEAGSSCDYCTYRTMAGEAMREHVKVNGKKLFK